MMHFYGSDGLSSPSTTDLKEGELGRFDLTPLK
jgi:hypothetical protein